MSRWKPHLAEIQEMLDELASDKQIARHFDAREVDIALAIARHGLRRSTVPEPKVKPIPIVRTYWEGNHLVKVGPPMWADGARSGDPFLIRPKR